jgi:carbon monoxide dehydrogenase subunit G
LGKALTDASRSNTKLYVTLGLVAAIVLGAIIAWNASVIEHVASGKQTKTFSVDCEFDRFRQIMVRKNATAAIVGHSGMKLLDERVQDIEVDTTADDRPLINAILGKTKSDVSAVKIVTVQLDDPTLEANELVLRQVADVEPTEINVVTQSTGAAGRLENYVTTLHAEPDAQSTKVTLTVDMNVRVKVPKLFVSRADERVQQAADEAIAGQAQAMQQFVAQHADKRLILPELGNP